MNILLLSRYAHSGPSSRYRSYQYLPYLTARGHAVTVAPLLSDDYVRRLYAGKRASVSDVAASYVRRFAVTRRMAQYDLVWVEYEAFPWVPRGLESLLLRGSSPYVVDYDDAVFHRYDRHSSALVRSMLGRKIDHVMAGAALVIAGNEYLAERARNAGAHRVEIVPTVVDPGEYPVTGQPVNASFTVGWIGTPSTVGYLGGIHDALRRAASDGGLRLTVVGAIPGRLDGVTVDARPWSETTEAREIAQFDAGIMPLDDTPWERGKCGHKLIKYMACARPVIASPVGVNRTIVEHGVNGFLASTTEEWVAAVRALRANTGLRSSMGLAGRRTVEARYSLTVTAPRLARLFEDVGGRR